VRFAAPAGRSRNGRDGLRSLIAMAVNPPAVT
jgi:hypothetical protein